MAQREGDGLGRQLQACTCSGRMLSACGWPCLQPCRGYLGKAGLWAVIRTNLWEITLGRTLPRQFATHNGSGFCLKEGCGTALVRRSASVQRAACFPGLPTQT